MALKNIFAVEIPFSKYGSSPYYFDLQDIRKQLELKGRQKAFQLANSDEAVNAYKKIIAELYAGVLNSTIVDQLYPFGVEHPEPLLSPSYDDDKVKVLFNTQYLPEIDGFDVLQVATRGCFTVRELLIGISEVISDGQISKVLDQPYSEWRQQDVEVLLIGIIALLGYESDVVLPALERWPNAIEGYESFVFYDDCFEYFVRNGDPLKLEIATGTSSIWGRIAKFVKSECD